MPAQRLEVEANGEAHTQRRGLFQGQNFYKRLGFEKIAVQKVWQWSERTAQEEAADSSWLQGSLEPWRVAVPLVVKTVKASDQIAA